MENIGLLIDYENSIIRFYTGRTSMVHIFNKS